ncbi:MAG TPA: hypothetical protein VFS18_04275 [Actinomycetota bacterium]|nr:hypothetical protein [Actinomycetota bacterium]
MTVDPLIPELRALVDEALAASDAEPLTGVPEDADLFIPDVLDSVGVATLLVLIEAHWEIEIDDEEIDPEVFESLSNVAAFVRSRVEPSS